MSFPAHDFRPVSALMSSRRPRRARRYGVLALVVPALWALAGCGVHLESATPSLPELSGFAVVRDSVARTESAALSRATALADSATECESCRALFTSVATASRERLAQVGGVWDPWEGREVSADAPQPRAVADAPVDVREFAAWLAASARRDLVAVADPAVASRDQAVTVASVALARYAQALRLADELNFSVDEASASVGREAQRVAALFPGEALPAWVILPSSVSWDLPESSSSTLWADQPEVGEAMRRWDCIAQSLPRAQVVEERVSSAASAANDLLRRVDEASARGGADRRELRCSFPASSAEDYARGLLEADFALMGAASSQPVAQGVRLLGARSAWEDVRTWRTFAPKFFARSVMAPAAQ